MQSKIIYGKRGCDFDKIALPFIKEALCENGKKEGCDCISCSSPLSSHPDYRLYDKESYLVEDIDSVVAYAMSPPLIAKRRVVYFKGLHTVTEVSQNKILKLLEDNQNFVMVATADSGGFVLPTIRSRTQRYFCSKCSKEEFLAIVGNESDGEFLYEMTGGYAGLIEEMREQTETFKKLEAAFLSKNRKMLYEAVSIVKDKDKNCYFEKYKGTLPQLFDFMIAQAGRNKELLEVLFIEKANALASWYTRNDFLVSIVNIGERLEVKDEQSFICQ